MSGLAIRAESLGKAYTIQRAVQAATYKTIREDLSGLWSRRFRGEGRTTIWALRNASFDVADGDVVGIVGRNGAGKSTLLKVLSRVTEPTTGRAEIFGRVGTLLEVGTGFHPELTGRENVFLSGAVLGMSRRDVRASIDDIFDFAGVGEFADTPVKRYSSGMFMRLAFAVAAHLQAEILVVDEVLAVGDSEFQQKCLGKMKDVSRSGRTVLFVSHNMAAVQQLCTRGIVIDRGEITFDGAVGEAVNRYLQSTREASAVQLASRTDRRGSGRLTFTHVDFAAADGSPLTVALSGRDLRIRFHYRCSRPTPSALVNLAFNVRTPQGYLLTNLNTVDAGTSRLPVFESGYFECLWPRLNLRSGGYDCALFCAIDAEIADWLQNAFRIEVEDGDFFDTGKLIQRDQGDILVPHAWAAVETDGGTV